jgi:putative ABC transport system permease protein
MPAIVIGSLSQDARVAARTLARDRGFTATAVLVLGLGIGVNTMLFTVLNAHTIRGLPIDRPDRVVYVSSLDDRRADRAVSYPDFEDMRASMTRLRAFGAFVNAPVVLGDEGLAPDRLDGTYLTPGAFAAIGVRAAAGRTFAPEDDRPGAPPVAMLTSAIWGTRYGSDPTVIGRTVLVNGAPATVIGIVPGRSGFPSTAEIWLPLSSLQSLARQQRDGRTLRVVGRLADGATLAEARAEIGSIAARLAREHPDTNTKIEASVVPINERFLGRLRDPAWLAFMTAGALVVLISCANVANLLLDRAVRRGREMAIRASLGATRRRVVAQLLVEAGLLASLGGTLGLGIARLGVGLFRAAIPATALPYWFDYSLDARVLASLAGVSVATVLIFGLVPAMSAARTDVSQMLKSGGPANAGGRGVRRWSTAFLVAELALTVVMLANLRLGFRIGRDAGSTNAALDTAEILTASITLPGDVYQAPDRRGAYYQRLLERLAAVPGVASSSAASALPLSGAQERRLEVAGFQASPGAAPPAAWTVAVAPRYFETLGLPLLAGREFGPEDGRGDARTAIVNQRLAQLYFGDRDPIGQRIRLRPAGTPSGPVESFEIVGLAPAIRQRPLPDPDPVVYLAFEAAPPSTGSLLVRGRGDAAVLAATVRSEAAAIDRNLPLYRLRTMAGVIADAEWNLRVSSGLILALTSLAVLLSTVGLAAVTAHRVTERTHEIGLRMALGARTHHVLQLILRRVVVQLGLGFAAGIACTIAWGALFSSGRPDALVSDPRALGFIGTALFVAGTAACIVPARRAARLDPVAAIRHG